MGPVHEGTLNSSLGNELVSEFVNRWVEIARLVTLGRKGGFGQHYSCLYRKITQLVCLSQVDVCGGLFLFLT